MPYALSPIGLVRCRARYRYEVPRQGVLGGGNLATVELNEDDPRLEQALSGLAGFERIWLVYLLHLNEHWRPLVRPPRLGDEKVGLFATRAPHRPNRIGLSCVELLGVNGRVLEIRNHDLLDRTPILDIKPYIPYADAFPAARTGWVDDSAEVLYTVSLAAEAASRSDWIAAHSREDIRVFTETQLSRRPTDRQRKRIRPATPGDSALVISYRMWRIGYEIDEPARRVLVTGVRSGYSPAELALPDDPEGDKELHRAFHENFRSAGQ